MLRPPRGLPRATADRHPADGVFERAAAGADRRHPVPAARRYRRFVDRDRALPPRPVLLQLQIPMVAADRPAADPDADRTARAASQLGIGASGGLGPGYPGPGGRLPAR